MVRSGGMTTTFDRTALVFALPSRNINHYEEQIVADGSKLFEAEWTSQTDAPFGGLGPHFDASACADCHGGDGRAAGPEHDGVLPVGFVVKLTTDDEAIAHRLGGQLTSRAARVRAEAVVSVSYEEVGGEFADGEPYSLRRPTYVAELTIGQLSGDAVLGVRVAPHLSGLGLLELIPIADLERRVDADDDDDDGVSGRFAEAVHLLSGEATIGRFGWNAGQPTIEQQSAAALFNDMGLTSRYFPVESCGSGGECERRGIPVTEYYVPSGFGSELTGSSAYEFAGEVSDERLYKLTVYAQALAVPAVRDVGDPVVARGWEVFVESGCSSCHAGPFTTGAGPIQGLSNQVIQPYTDLLVHDLGDGLADRTVDGDIVDTEWRTAPLWGVGMIETVNGHANFLHDGRARGFSEAILWHGGEGQASADVYREMSATDRVALIRFLESL